MSYMLLIGIIFVALPIIVLEVLVHIIFFGMLKDDKDMFVLIYVALGLVATGFIMIGLNYGVKLL